MRVRAAVSAAVLAVAVAGFATLEGRHQLSVRRYDPATTPICRVDTTERVVALSFDDGPDRAFTPSVLALLRSNDVSATFFVIGSRAERSPDLVAAEVGIGAEVASHTWSHVDLSSIPETDARAEIARGVATLDADVPSAVEMFRPPFGVLGSETARYVDRTLGFEVVDWSIPLDHYVADAAISPSVAARRIVNDIDPGDIILAHDATLGSDDGNAERRRALATVSRLIPLLLDGGYRVTTVGDLLATGAPVRATPRPWFWQRGFECPDA
jgi:peptidoglycan/xylan/chitin deacetylase (PgdA/CDA1 family)